MYKKHLQELIRDYDNLSIVEGSVEDLVLSSSAESSKPKCCGVILGGLETQLLLFFLLCFSVSTFHI